MTTAIDLPDWVASVDGPTSVLLDGPIANDEFAVAGYQGLEITLSNTDNTSPLVASYAFFDPTGFVLEQGVLSADATQESASFTLPVLGPRFELDYAVSGASIDARVIAGPVRFGKRLLNDMNVAREFSATIPSGTTNLTATELPGMGLSSDAHFPDLSSYNGLCTFVYQISTAAGITSMPLQYEVMLTDGLTRKVQLNTTTTNAPVVFNAGHPLGYVKWFAVNHGVPTADITVTLLIIPAETT